MITKELTKLLEKREFISVGTCDFEGKPNAAHKFLLRVDGDTIYLVDYTIGTTWNNIKINPRASLSFLDLRTLKGYQLNGSVKIIDRGAKFNRLRKEMQDKAIHLTTQHIIEDIRGEGKHESFEVVITEKFVILEVDVNEVAEIGIGGELKRNKAA